MVVWCSRLYTHFSWVWGEEWGLEVRICPGFMLRYIMNEWSLKPRHSSEKRKMWEDLGLNLFFIGPVQFNSVYQCVHWELWCVQCSGTPDHHQQAVCEGLCQGDGQACHHTLARVCTKSCLWCWESFHHHPESGYTASLFLQELNISYYNRMCSQRER